MRRWRGRRLGHSTARGHSLHGPTRRSSTRRRTDADDARPRRRVTAAWPSNNQITSGRRLRRSAAFTTAAGRSRPAFAKRRTQCYVSGDWRARSPALSPRSSAWSSACARRAPKCRTRTCSDDIDDPVIRHSSTTTFLALRAVAD